ncbi:MAG: leucine-rich repeat protein [Acetatifactor sp.]
MKAKRILAMVLSIAIVATSSNFTLDVDAMGNMEELPTAVLEQVGAVSGDVTPGDVPSGDVTPGDVTSGDATSDDVIPEDVTRDDVISGDVTPGDVISGDVTPDDAISEDVPSGDIISDDVTSSDVISGDMLSGAIISGDVTPGDVSPGYLVSGNDIYKTTNEYFTVDENGTLQLRAGVELSSLKGTVVLPASVKRIPAGIFDKNVYITGLTIPDDSQLSKIDAGAFERSGVTSLKIPDAVTEIADETFKDSKLSTITFTTYSNLTSIGSEAFAGSKLTKMVIPGNVTQIGTSAFKTCLSLASLDMGEVEVIGVDAFKGCTALKTSVAWSKSLKEIGNSAFEGSGIAKVDMSTAGANITTWGTSVFAECKNLGSVKLHADMEVIPNGLFQDCVNLSSLTLPANCQKIEGNAFYGCDALASVTIPARVGIIEAGAFGGCQNLKTIIIKQQSSNGTGESDIILAEEAFPRKDGVTMKGYDGTVEDYADKRRYSFTSLIPANSISKEINRTSWGAVELSANSAKQGETVEVTVTPNANYRLKAGTFYYYLDDDDSQRTYITKLVKETATAQVFSFVMPSGDVTVHVDFQAADTSYGTLSVDYFDTNGEMIVDWDSSKKIATFDKVGIAAKLVIKSSVSPTASPSCWQYTYTSSNKKVAVIDEEGMIYASSPGTATITATLKTDTSKVVKFKVQVTEEADIDNVELKFSDIKKAKVTTETINGESFTVIQYTKNNLSKRAKEFTVGLKATSGYDSTNLFVSSTWKSANTNLVYPENTTVRNNSNTIHVKSGVSGETAITVKATNGLTGKDQVVYGEEQTFIVRVVDATPRLIQSTLTVNALSTVGTEFDLISVYGYEVEPTTLRVVEDVKDGNIREYEESSYLNVRYENRKCYLELTEEGKNALSQKGRDISYADRMYIEGKYTYMTEAGEATDTFRTPIKSLVLTSKALKPTVKTSGKLNLFFNSNASVEELGKVVLTQSLKNLTVERYELVSEANYAKKGSEAVDSFANNFVVSVEGVITRSDKELITDAKGKVVTKGYLKITYEGYEPCYVKLTVPVRNTKPSYVLSATKATVNTYSDGYEIRLLLQDKKTKKSISLANLHELSFDESAAGATTNLFESLDTEAAKQTGAIALKIRNTQKGKAIINVEMDTWNEPMKFTFNLSVTNRIPTVKAKSAALTLNNLCIGRKASTIFTVSQKDVTLTGMSKAQFIGKAALASEAEKIQIQFADGVLSASADRLVKTGSYKFSLVPKLTYADGKVEEAKAITITVKVAESKLTMALKTKTMTLNNRFVSYEQASTVYTIKNMPVSENVEIVSDDVVITGTNTTATAALDAFKFIFETDKQILSVKQLGKVRAATYNFKITGLKTLVEGNEVEIQPFTISVKVTDANPKVTLKTSGILNPCSSDSKIIYTFTVSNVNAKITGVQAQELDTRNGLNKPFDELENFQVEAYINDENGSITGVIVKPKDDVSLNAKTSYKLKIGIELEGADEPVWSSALSVKVKQTLPKIKTDVTSTTVYAGVAFDSLRRSQEVLITKTSEKSAVIEDVVLSGSNSDNLKKAFKVTFDPDTQKAKVTLMRPDMVKGNTEYNIKFEVKVKGQMENTTRPTFTMKIKVLN